MKTLLIICDGMADRPIPALGYKTPLEIADTPNMDWLAKRGISGIMDTIAPGTTPGSDTAHLALLGYDPYQTYTGRGPFEAAGAGIDLKPGDIAFRVNYATVDKNLVVTDRRAGRIQETKALAEAIQNIKLKGAEFIFRSTVGHRATLVLRGKGLSHEVSDSDPHEEGKKPLKVVPLLQSEEGAVPAYPIIAGGVRKYVMRRRWAAKTAKLLNEFSQRAYEVLKKHPVNIERAKNGLPPANYLLIRGGGVVPHLVPFYQRFRIKGACVAAAALVKGVCKLAGMTVVDVPGATGGVNTDLNAKAKAALQQLQDHDLVLLHVKGSDEASHDGNIKAKIEIIERVDSIINQFIDSFDFIAVTADHTTSISVKNHTADPVPVVISGPGVRTDDVRTFSERAAAKGGLGRIRGKYLLPIIIDLMGKSSKFGA
ncbi:MAG: 2,3-bisphosphoglycerate-independent phosphoglycerate mutase [Candidatus Hadarchaeum sp.]|uniref:2,3-bisphosphoglycerate-independent phosphoglycerate mutase n=1 Tax=Candidatus Hadarchaeum sp. TaxID=2883567 RepID=UPI003D14D2C2